MSVKQIIVALDQLGNTFLPGGYADETISSHCWRMAPRRRAWSLARRAIDWVALNAFRQTDHCQKSYLAERARSQEPPELRGIIAASK